MNMTIKDLRSSTGMSQREFSSYFGIPIRTLQKWETGERTPPGYVLSMMEKRIYMEKSVNVRRMPTIEAFAEICRQGGYEVEILDLEKAADKNCYFNPLLAATEQASSIEEKSIKLRELLEMPEYGSEYAKQRLSDMSFLDDEPEWREAAKGILMEYIEKQ